MDRPLATHIAEHLRSEAVGITSQWVAILVERLGVEPERALPSDSILNHIPQVLRTIADFTENPGDDPLDSMVRRDLSALADLRRRQGFSLTEVLAEFAILSKLVEDSILRATERYPGDPSREDLVRIVGRLKDAIFLLGSETATRFRQWHDRHEEERARLIETYTAMLSHELGNRLGAAETAIQLILEEGLELSASRVANLHEMILKSLQSGRHTVHGVRALFAAGADPGQVRSMPLGTVIRDAVHQMNSAAADRGIELELIESGPDEPIDAERLPLAFFNLVSNAIRHHDLVDGTGRITVEVSADNDNWIVSVDDDGPGIPEPLRDRLFEPLVRDASAGGAGLGLAIAREAVEQMGGRIWVESNSPRGTRFHFTMPKLGRPANPASG
ncbi:MAG TPA: sensor histidine kinase [Longimicrobiales bacterium]|nr:sensor histidine kinase [Longimicrobiales bacterium]